MEIMDKPRTQIHAHIMTEKLIRAALQRQPTGHNNDYSLATSASVGSDTG